MQRTIVKNEIGSENGEDRPGVKRELLGVKKERRTGVMRESVSKRNIVGKWIVVNKQTVGYCVYSNMPLPIIVYMLIRR